MAMRSTPCREWPGPKDKFGHGRRVRRRSALSSNIVSRQVIEMAGEDQHGTPWNASLVVMHECDNPPCFNYWHLRLGTQADNLADMRAKGRQAPPPMKGKHKTHCPLGHELTPENVYMNGQYPTCRRCKLERQRKANARKRGQ